MKKVLILLLPFILVISGTFSPNVIKAKAEANTLGFDLEGLEYTTVVDEKAETVTVQGTQEGESGVAELDFNKGVISLDGDLIGFIRTDTTDLAITDNSSITFENPDGRTYVIGSASNGSGSYALKYSDTITVSLIGLAIATFALSLLVLGIMSGAGIITLAQATALSNATNFVNAVMALAGAITSENTTFVFKFKHYKDKNYKFFYKDVLDVYKSKVSDSNHKAKIVHYYGSLVR